MGAKEESYHYSGISVERHRAWLRVLLLFTKKHKYLWEMKVHHITAGIEQQQAAVAKQIVINWQAGTTCNGQCASSLLHAWVPLRIRSMFHGRIYLLPVVMASVTHDCWVTVCGCQSLPYAAPWRAPCPRGMQARACAPRQCASGRSLVHVIGLAGGACYWGLGQRVQKLFMHEATLSPPLGLSNCHPNPSHTATRCRHKSHRLTRLFVSLHVPLLE